MWELRLENFGFQNQDTVRRSCGRLRVTLLLKVAGVTVRISDLRIKKNPNVANLNIVRHSTYIVRAPPSFFILFKTFYRTFHQVMSPDRGAYSLKKNLLYYSPTIVHLTCHLQVCRPQKSERQNATWPCHNNEQSINHQLASKCYLILFSS